MADQLNNAATGTIAVGQGSKITLATANTYIPNNIELIMDVVTANPQFDGGAISGGSTAEFTHISTSDSDNGIKVQTKYTVTRGDVLYNGAIAGWVAKDDNTVALSGDSISSTNGSAYYITAIEVPTDKAFNVTTQSDTALDSSSDLTITNGAFRKVVISNNGTVALTSGANNKGDISISAYANGSDASAENAQSVVTNGVWNTTTINPTSSAQGPVYGKVNITAVSQTNLSAANIKDGTIVTVKGGNNNIYNVTGTFTSDGTISAAEVLSGYVAYSKAQRIVGEMPNNGATGATITTQNGTYTIPAGYTTGGTVTATFPVTSVSQPDSTKNSTTKVVTRANASWGTGYITNGTMSAATFANTATSGTTYIDLSDGLDSNNNNIIPEIPSGGYLYINKGYIDNFKISLARLIPDTAAVNSLSGDYILSGHSAFDNAGNLIVGSITSKSAETFYPSSNDQTVSASQYLSGVQTFKAVKLTNISAANIKYNVTVEVGDNEDSDRVTSVTGTFTATPSGKTALTAAALRSGYAGFINGTQVDGSMPDISVTPAIANTSLSTYFNSGTSSSNSISLTPTYTNNTAGYLAQHTSAQSGTTVYYTIKTATFSGDGGNVALVADTTSNSIYQSAANNGNVSVESSAPATNSGYMYIKLTGSGTAKCATAGWIEANGATTTGSSTKYIKILKYDGSYTVT